jgi:hypothetical protein
VSDTRAGQPSEKTPDFIPGWFLPRPGNPDPGEREAVRFIGTQDFPINFLRDGEAVWLPKRPQLGVCIGQRKDSDFCLAVPPGYWIVRDSDGDLGLWREEDFAKKWIRNDGRDWIAPVERLRDNPHVPPGYAEKLIGELAKGSGWEGTPPAQGTRRALIRDTIAASTACEGEAMPWREVALGLADEIEKALLQAAIDDEAMRRADESMTTGIVDAGAVLSQSERKSRGEERPAWRGEPPAAGTRRKLIADILRVEDVLSETEVREFADSIELALLGHVDVDREDRDDAWVSEVAYQAAGAATRPLLEDHPDYVFPAERVRDAVAELLSDFGIARACVDCAEEQLGHGAKEVDGRRDATIKGLSERNESLLAQREQSRASEDTYKAQRDASLHLLRWLIGDLIPADLLRFEAES